jgi:hypothetical protein
VALVQRGLGDQGAARRPGGGGPTMIPHFCIAQRAGVGARATRPLTVTLSACSRARLCRRQTSLVAQRLDGVHARGLDGGDHAGDEAHGEQHARGDEHRGHGDV